MQGILCRPLAGEQESLQASQPPLSQGCSPVSHPTTPPGTRRNRALWDAEGSSNPCHRVLHRELFQEAHPFLSSFLAMHICPLTALSTADISALLPLCVSKLPLNKQRAVWACYHLKNMFFIHSDWWCKYSLFVVAPSNCTIGHQSVIMFCFAP